MNTKHTYTLREMRHRSKLSTKVIATELNVSLGTLFGWENGTIQIPILRLHSLLGLYNQTMDAVDWDQLITSIETKAPNGKQ